MIPRPLLPEVTAYLAVEGYSLMTAPIGLIKALIARVEAERRRQTTRET
jgi:hypothetical protein